ncbi:type IV secretory system conjugative DNA transfer family protein, partial [Streptomyces caniscabiei]|uniref:type IV secretory system conjugative DNA transfer family protein n=1 Tax=Streptomyces caniscabiei TaxID=2746961 RepID=UPI0038F81C68
NNNDLIIGPSGAGKTRGYVIPNILQCNGSMVVADTKGTICPEVGPILAQEGYKVMEINLADCALSPYGYNPLAYIRRDRYGRFS